MSLEDHLLSLVKQMKTMAESVGETVGKVVEELGKDKAKTPAEPEKPAPEPTPPRFALRRVSELTEGVQFLYRNAAYTRRSVRIGIATDAGLIEAVWGQCDPGSIAVSLAGGMYFLPNTMVQVAVS